MPEYDPATDPRSANVLIQSYLLSKGITPGMPGYAQSVRTALEANAANPGLIHDFASTLTNSTPSTEADDQAAMARARGAGGGGPVGRSSGSFDGSGQGPSVGGVGGFPTGVVPDRDTGNTSAPPTTTSVGPMPSVGAIDAAGVAVPGGGAGAMPGVSAGDIASAALAGAGAGAGWWLGSPGQPRVSLGMPNAGQLPPPGGGGGGRPALPGGGAPPSLSGPGVPLSLGAPAPQLAAPAPVVAAPAPAVAAPGPATAAIDKAVGDTPAPRRARAPRARVKVPKL